MILFNVNRDFTKKFVLDELKEKVEGVEKVEPFREDKHYKIYFDTAKNQATALATNKLKLCYNEYKFNLPNLKPCSALSVVN